MSTNPWVLLDLGLWFTFVVWAFALNMCMEDSEDD
jgi:hypothetical protein